MPKIKHWDKILDDRWTTAYLNTTNGYIVEILKDRNTYLVSLITRSDQTPLPNQPERFNTKEKALKVARNYMRKNPVYKDSAFSKVRELEHKLWSNALPYSDISHTEFDDILERNDLTVGDRKGQKLFSYLVAKQQYNADKVNEELDKLHDDLA